VLAHQPKDAGDVAATQRGEHVGPVPDGTGNLGCQTPSFLRQAAVAAIHRGSLMVYPVKGYQPGMGVWSQTADP
jgi:hypothetical protein